MRPATFRFVVTGNGERLDRLVADATGRGRRAVREMLRSGSVKVNGRIAAASDVPSPGSEVEVDDPAADVVAATAQAASPADWRVVVENERFVVVMKPAGLHCERGKSPGSLAELVEERYGALARVGDRPEEGGLVHRIDRDTSGIVVVARERQTWLRLRRAFPEGRTRKQYLALAGGRLGAERTIDLPLARRAHGMTIAGRNDDALAASTTARTLESGEDWSLVLATMTTGAMHQIRVHLAAIGHPLIGDTLYGGPVLAGSLREGQLLHALRIEIAGELDVSAGPPHDFLAAYAALRRANARALTSSS